MVASGVQISAAIHALSHHLRYGFESNVKGTITSPAKSWAWYFLDTASGIRLVHYFEVIIRALLGLSKIDKN